MPPNLLIFASGTKKGGGSGFENLVRAAESGTLRAHIVGVVSNHEQGGVRERAERLEMRFFHFPPPWTAEEYRRIKAEAGAEFCALSGWLKPVAGLASRTTFNIHPAPLPRFSGKGMYGLPLHRAVLDAYRKGELTHSAVTMHFVADEYDTGPVFFSTPVPIEPDDTPETLQARAKNIEHQVQPIVTDKVVHGEIRFPHHPQPHLATKQYP